MSVSPTPKRPPWVKFLPPFIVRRLDGRDGVVSIIHNSGWLMLDKVARLLLGLLVGAWVARHLGPAQYGELAYALAYIAFFQALATLGLDGLVVRDISNAPSDAGKILGSVFFIRLIFGVGCWLSAVGGMALINGIDSRTVVLTAVAGGALVFQAADTIDLWFQSQSQVKRTVLAKLAAYVISSGIKVLLILINAPLVYFAAVIAFDALAAAGGLIFSYKLYPCKDRWVIVQATSKALLREGWPFMLSGISVVAYMRIDQIMIREMMGESDLGIYAAVIPLAALGQIVPVTFATSLAPFLARKKAQGEEAYWKALKAVFQAMALIGWVSSIVIVLFSELIVHVLFGEKYQAGATVLAAYALTNLFISLGVAQWLWSLNERKSVFYLYKTLAGGLVCVLGNLFVIPRFGLIGVAWVAVLAQFTSVVATNLYIAPRVLKLQLSSIFMVGYIFSIIRKLAKL